MIIKCEKCLTKFRIDDARVTEKGVKVRCTKCKHVFAVRREQQAPEAEETQTALELCAIAMTETVPAFAQSEFPQPESEPPTPFSFESSSEPPQEIAENFEEPAATAHVEAENRLIFSEPETDGFIFAAEEESCTTPPAPEPDASTPDTSADDIDFASFDFGDSSAEAVPDAKPTEPPAAAVDTISDVTTADTPYNAAHGLDFSDDDMFGSVAVPKVEESTEAISFDFDTDSFAESIDTGIPDAGGKDAVAAAGLSADTPFSLGDIDFGDELTSVAVQQVNPEEFKPSQEILFAPLAQAQEKTSDEQEAAPALEGSTTSNQQELPPLPIASRRKQSPLFGGVLTVIALLVVATLGYFGFSAFSPEKVKSPEENGKINVIGVKAAFIESSKTGTLLVISGEARNDFSKPRAALLVKGLVYGAAGQVLASKEAYCGNKMTMEQLESFPLERIEATMSNQFGDSLDNMEVAPGKAVPFTIVIPAPPQGAKDFGVEVVSSTVATGKQQ